jgi:hypothetical protein
MRRINRKHLVDDEPVEKHADRSKVLLDSRFRRGRLQRLYIGGDVQRLDIGKLADLVALDPAEEQAHGPVIGHARVPVTNLGGEKFKEAPRGMLAGVGDHRRHLIIGDSNPRIRTVMLKINRGRVLRII